MSTLIDFDLSKEGCLIGIDEVGRGCFAGDAYVAAVHLKNLKNKINQAEFDFLGELTDSKKLSEVKREELAKKIANAFEYKIVKASVKDINKKKLGYCIMQSMNTATNKLVQKANLQSPLVLVDGIQRIPNIEYEQETIKKGDSHSMHIAAASIIAKVARDKYMKELALKYPEYGWESNKGYGTKKHLETIKQYGITPEHRIQFVETSFGEEFKNLKIQ